MTEVTDVGVRPPFEPQYIGDGVEVVFDGYQVWLCTKDGTNQQIALRPDVYAELRRYARQFWGQRA